MTSSLVGSEMCIRDRPVALLRTSYRGQNVPWRPFTWARGAIGAHCPTTVSYTHLTLPTICSV
eukprot:12737454-Prorocentrum_lima.AAC.1